MGGLVTGNSRFSSNVNSKKQKFLRKHTFFRRLEQHSPMCHFLDQENIIYCAAFMAIENQINAPCALIAFCSDACNFFAVLFFCLNE